MARQVLSTVEIALVLIVPLILFYQRSTWRVKGYWKTVVLLYALWFATYAFFHELSHLIGASMAGCHIIDYRLIPRFWLGDFYDAWVKATWDSGYKGFISTMAPYLRDVALSILGLFLIKKVGEARRFVAGLLLVSCVLSPIYDVVNNVSIYLCGNFAGNDFDNLAGIVGGIWASVIALSFCGLVIAPAIGVYRICRPDERPQPI